MARGIIKRLLGGLRETAARLPDSRKSSNARGMRRNGPPYRYSIFKTGDAVLFTVPSGLTLIFDGIFLNGNSKKESIVDVDGWTVEIFEALRSF